MKVFELMTANPACCTPDTPLSDVARLMLGYDCGEVPVVDNRDTMKLVGVITDRDITCRSVAQDKNPLELKAGDCMTADCVTVAHDATLEQCSRIMEQHQVRRLPVVNGQHECQGIIAQADLARQAPSQQVAGLLKEVSQPQASA